MQLETIRAIHGYNDWATGHILTCCEQLTPEQLTQDASLPWGSIRNQLVHQFIVHRRWLSWVDGTMSGEEAYALRADPDDYPDLSSVRDMWDQLQRQNRRFLATASDDELGRLMQVEFPGSEFSIPAWQVMLHIAHHSMQHRTEISVALTHFGASPGDIDYIFYVLEKS